MLGGDANGVPWKDFCWQEWKSRYGTSPPWGAKEFAQLADARKRLDTEQLAREAWTLFLKAEGVYFEGHSPGQFLSNLSRMTARAVRAIPKKPAQVQGESVSAYVRIMREVYNDPKFTTRQEMKDETARRLREING